MSAESHAPTGRLALLTALLFATGPVTVDLSLPAMPSIQNAIASSGMRVELTLTLLFLGLTLSQLVYGAAADRFGRRKPLVAGLIVYSIASVAAAFAPNLIAFGLARLIQAFAYGVAVVTIRSAVVDVCDERRTARVFSVAITAVSVAAVVSPALGGRLLDTFGWQSIFVAMGAFGLLTLVAVMLLLPETFPPARRSSAGLSSALSTYGTLLRNRRFTAFAVICATAAAFQLTYNTGSPAVAIDHYGMSPSAAGLLFSIIALSTALSAQVNALLLKWFSLERLVHAGVAIGLLASAALLVSVFSGLGGVTGLTVALFALIASLGFLMGNGMAAAISSAGAQAGAASALVGVMQFLFGTVGSGIVGLVPDAAGRPMGVVIATLALLALLMTAWARPATRSRTEAPAHAP